MKLKYTSLLCTILYSSFIFSSDLVTINSYDDIAKASTCIFQSRYRRDIDAVLVCDGKTVATTSSYERSPYVTLNRKRRFTAIADILLKLGFVYDSGDTFVKSDLGFYEDIIVECEAAQVNGKEVTFTCGDKGSNIPLGTKIEVEARVYHRAKRQD